jgi:putative membrane protein insertion efficiency factor
VKLPRLILIALIQCYRWVLSPAKAALFGPLGRCRFEPTCSNYALAAVRRHGALRGGWLAARRVCSCHPYGGCGYDPVPEQWPASSVAEGQGRVTNAAASPNEQRAAEFAGLNSDFVIRHSSFPTPAQPVPASR